MKLVENAKPKKNPVWLGIRILLLFALFVVVGLLPAVSVIPASAVPPLADLQRSEGTISVRASGRSGGITVLKSSGGDQEEFSCRDNMGMSFPCIHSRYTGGFAQIHWFWVRMPFGERYKFPAQIVVNGEVVRERSAVIAGLEKTRVDFQFMFAPLIFIGFLAGVFVMVVDRGDVAVDKGGEV